MARYIVRERADLDIDEIADYIARNNVSAGHRFILAARREFTFLSENPRAGSTRYRMPMRLRGLRSWPIKGFMNYLIFYLPGDTAVEIVRIIHGARNINRLINES